MEYSSDKKYIRHLLKQRRSTLRSDEKVILEQQITGIVVESAMFHQAKKVHCYLAWGDEVDTTAILSAALQAGKQVFCPYNLQKNGVMHHAKLTDISNVQKGLWGLTEPNNPSVIYTSLADFSDEDLILVPLLGFDEQLYRLGYGKGFYDRALQFTSAVTCGIAFSVQKVSTVLPLQHDIQLHEVITEYGCCKKQQ